VSIGQTLAESRRRAGLSVVQVSDKTRIRQTLIRKIEADDYTGCGGDVYVRGHLKTIATVVGIDPQPLLAEFTASHPAEAVPSVGSRLEASGHRVDRRGPNWTTAMAVALAVVLMFAVVRQVAGSTGSATDGVSRSVVPGNSSSEPSTPPTTAPSPGSPAASISPQGLRDDVTVVLKATGSDSWLTASGGTGRNLFEGLLNRGQSRSFTDTRRIRVVLGNAGAVRVTVNGKDVGAAGSQGEVVRLDFTPTDSTVS
jgi:cytoskeleton protein RodZ